MLKIPFTKMHGIGNDYIYVNCLEKELPLPGKISAAMSPRHFSVGADGLVMICSSEIADAKMRMFNLDGSEGKMCGNAIRCVGKYLYENGLVKKTELAIETLSGIKHLQLHTAEGRVERITVDMGKAIWDASEIPVISESARVIDAPLNIDGDIYHITCVSMGNPHAVVYIPDPDALNLDTLGPKFEYHPAFPERVNTEFIRAIDRKNLRMRVWERGSGETYACGTGACAAAVASILNGCCDLYDDITVHLVGGDLVIRVEDDFRVSMTGPATKVYEGIYEYED